MKSRGEKSAKAILAACLGRMADWARGSGAVPTEGAEHQNPVGVGYEAGARSASSSRIRRRPKPAAIRAAVRAAGFLLFALVYYAPLLLEPSNLAVSDSRVSMLLSHALAVPAIQGELLRNLAAHLLLLSLCYTATMWMAGQVARATGVRTGVSCLFFLAAVWLLLMVGNHLLFPLSDFSWAFDAIAHPGVVAATVLVLVAGGIVAVFRTFPPKRVAAGAALAGIIGLSVGAGHWSAVVPAAIPKARNIVIVGVDSLSGQMAQAARNELPHLAALLEHATVFERAYTPLARTFPAWVSLLSGRAPAEHRAIFNLRSLDRVERDALVTRTLSEAGYRTVFAMDERRFSNIDESFGFDRVVGPKAGALDFVLSSANDTPLTNVLLQTRVGAYLLPFSHLNVASYANYDADGFVDETLAAIDETQPLFLAVHFESAHFPFRTRHALRDFDDPNHFVSLHMNALTVVDAQVGRLMNGLRDSGRLADALVIVLSDHGESLGEVEAQTTRAGELVGVSAYGHGANLLSEHQNRIVLSLVRFRNGRPVGSTSLRTEQVSLTDLRATIERYARSGEVALHAGSDCMTVETGLRLAAASDYKALDVGRVAREGAGYYEIDRAGRMHLREDMLPALVDTKDVGWRCRDRLTVYSPVDDRYVAYRIDEDGLHRTEVEPVARDIARIDAYRARLRDAVGE